ncbi:hypothetical protein KUM39_01620 [Streptomyces sp. J2-1]|uniref:hypothetical protein n=1 Tax=Streptomyces corallincola TaxID=2851888 RepID=UPI001C380141|nr:hypothetical protein [Streptomyces corallincola]MBV2353068.1 hypothetical protein [Streptomyces corallincola]
MKPRARRKDIRVRTAHAATGAVMGLTWLTLPLLTPPPPAPAISTPHPHHTTTTAPEPDRTADLLPLLVAATALGFAAYTHRRRTRRAGTRTTPALVSPAPPTPTPLESERQTRAALVRTDDCIRTSEEELSFAATQLAPDTLAPFTDALRRAHTEFSAAAAIWRRYEESGATDTNTRRHAQTGVLGRCAEAGRLLDARADPLDRLRALEEAPARPLARAESRFRALTPRTAAASATTAELRRLHTPSAVTGIAGYVEQAKDRLVFATARLNESHQRADRGEPYDAARQLRAAEGAVVQAEVLIGAVERLAAALREAAALVPPALTAAESHLGGVRAGRAPAAVASADLAARLARADAALAAVRTGLTSGPYDPLDALRWIVRAVEDLETGLPGALRAAARLVAGTAVAAADDFVGVHRGVTGARARARLSAAQRALDSENFVDADTLAGEARELAERDVLAHSAPDTAAHQRAAGGLAGAVLGGVLLAEEPDAGPPACFGGPETRARRRAR